MINRPKDLFIGRMCCEDPPDNLREDFIIIYNTGGLNKFENKFKAQMGNLPTKMICLAGNKYPQLSKWLYVGHLWWCRKVVNLYEFAMFMVAKNDKYTKIEGLWDARKHIIDKPPVIVYKSDKTRGIIVGRNEYEILVKWDNSSITCPVRNINELIFKYIEDFQEYKFIFSKIRKHV